MPDPSINVGLGYVVRGSDGEYAGDFKRQIADEHVNDDAEAFQAYVNDAARSEGLSVAAYRFGLDLNGVALVAEATVKEADGWAASHSDLAPDDVKTAGGRNELYQAADALGWDVGDTGEPQWLVLVAYG